MRTRVVTGTEWSSALSPEPAPSPPMQSLRHASACACAVQNTASQHGQPYTLVTLVCLGGGGPGGGRTPLCDIPFGGVPPPPPPDRIPSTDQAVRGGRHGQKVHSGSPPGRGMPPAVQMPAVVRMPACHGRRFKGERPIGAAQANRANHRGLVPNPPPLLLQCTAFLILPC